MYADKTKQYFYDGTIILQEWDKYKVKALDGSLVPEDFIKVGEFMMKNLEHYYLRTVLVLPNSKDY